MLSSWPPDCTDTVAGCNDLLKRLSFCDPHATKAAFEAFALPLEKTLRLLNRVALICQAGVLRVPLASLFEFRVVCHSMARKGWCRPHWYRDHLFAGGIAGRPVFVGSVWLFTASPETHGLHELRLPPRLEKASPCWLFLGTEATAH